MKVYKLINLLGYKREISEETLLLLRTNRLRKNNFIDEDCIKDILNSSEGLHISIRRLTYLYNSRNPDLKISKSTLHNHLVYYMKIKYKKPIILHQLTTTNLSKIFRIIFLKKLSNYITNNFTIIYLDESSFNLNNNRYKTWVGEGVNEINYSEGKIMNTTLAIACCKNEIIYYKLMKRSMNGDKFTEFFKAVYFTTIKKYGKRIVFYLDNAPCHHYKKLKEFARLNAIHILYGVPYLCCYNMSEYVFSILKKTYYSKVILNE